jgi:hypothetical protein
VRRAPTTRYASDAAVMASMHRSARWGALLYRRKTRRPAPVTVYRRWPNAAMGVRLTRPHLTLRMPRAGTRRPAPAADLPALRAAVAELRAKVLALRCGLCAISSRVACNGYRKCTTFTRDCKSVLTTRKNPHGLLYLRVYPLWYSALALLPCALLH